MTMQHKRGTFFQFDGKEVEIRDYALLKMGNARRAQEIRIDQIGMASKRIADDYPELAGWFCLKIMGTREFAVEEALKKAGVEALVPAAKGEEIRRRRRVVEAPLVPVLRGYVLVRCVPSAAAMAGLRRFERVLDIVGTAEKPFRVPEKFVSKFISKVEDGAYDHRPPSPTEYRLGERVKVVDGPFASFPAEVVSQDMEGNRLTVEVEIFGRPTPVDLDVAQVEKV